MDQVGLELYIEVTFSFCEFRKKAYLCSRRRGKGIVAEWLGRGLQNLVQRFDSARYL